MGLKPRKGLVKRSSSGLTEADYTYYSWGDFFEAEDYEVGKTEAQLHAFWKRNEREIMARFLEDRRARGWPADRPWSWWKWSAPKPQRRILPKKDDNLRRWDHKNICFDWIESDAEYLRRLNLLQPWEIEALEKRPFA